VGGVLEHKKVVAVSCGGFHTAVLLKDGKVFAWGEGLNGQVSPPLSFLPAPSLSYSLLLVLSSRLSASWHALAAHALAAHAQRYHVRGAPHAA